MQPYEITPDEAIGAVSAISERVTFDIPDSYQAKMAAFMLVVADVCTSDCQCDHCQRTREIFADIM